MQSSGGTIVKIKKKRKNKFYQKEKVGTGSKSCKTMGLVPRVASEKWGYPFIWSVKTVGNTRLKLFIFRADVDSLDQKLGPFSKGNKASKATVSEWLHSLSF